MTEKRRQRSSDPGCPIEAAIDARRPPEARLSPFPQDDSRRDACAAAVARVLRRGPPGRVLTHRTAPTKTRPGVQRLRRAARAQRLLLPPGLVVAGRPGPCRRGRGPCRLRPRRRGRRLRHSPLPRSGPPRRGAPAGGGGARRGRRRPGGAALRGSARATRTSAACSRSATRAPARRSAASPPRSWPIFARASSRSAPARPRSSRSSPIIFGTGRLFVGGAAPSRPRGGARQPPPRRRRPRARPARRRPRSDVRHAMPQGKPLFDVLTCIRQKTTLDDAGRLLSPNAERHLQARPARWRALFRDLPEAVRDTAEIAARCAFTLDDLATSFPTIRVPPTDASLDGELRHRTMDGARRRYGGPSGPRWPRARRSSSASCRSSPSSGSPATSSSSGTSCASATASRILVQGRGSAANSAVCYALGITAVDPVGMDLLFERFLSEERPATSLAGHRPRPAQRRPARGGHPARLPALRRAPAPP